MNIRMIQYGSDDYKKECELRNKILRVPLGLSLYDENLSREKDYLHFGLFENNELIACAIAVMKNIPQIKQVAVDEKYQHESYGKIIMKAVETELLKRGYKNWFLNARKPVIGFYEKLGYKCVGEEFIEIGLPHKKMKNA